MPFDSFPERDFVGGDPWWQQCKSCKRPIAANEPVEHIKLDPDASHRAQEVNGIYHADCARPFLSLVRALNTMRRWG